jgi:hypothetical protein
MDRLFAGPLGLLLVIAQAGFFVYIMRGLFRSSNDDGIGATFKARRGGRREAPRPRPRREGASEHGSHGWSKTASVLETYFNPETEAMSGRVLTGPYQGRRLEDLTRPDCLRLYDLCRTEDPEAAEFLKAYMLRRFAGDGPRGRHEDRRQRAAPPADDDGPMTRDGAYAVLGLQSGANEAEIHRAHRTLIKKHHPDHGGSHALAAQINQAKDLLLAKAP